MSTGPQWQALRLGLKALSQRVGEEICSYPRSITACDAQFNYLLELRLLLPYELDRLEAAAQDPAATVTQFIEASPCAGELAQSNAPRSALQPV